MATWITVVRVAAGFNCLVLLAMTAIWARNYLEIRSKYPLGLLVFGSLLFVENAFTFYIFLFDPLLSQWFSGNVPASVPGHGLWSPANALTGIKLLESGALVFLAWVTWD